MIDEVKTSMEITSDEEIEELSAMSFSDISSLYQRHVEASKQQKYNKDHFTNVKLDSYKTKIFDVDWPYVYTLNIDDAIEKNSEYNCVIYSNRIFRNEIFADNKCVIKLHGDIGDMLKYVDSGCQIFTTKQYIDSLKKNIALLTKLGNDIKYNNIIFIGCSLNDEIDLLSLIPDKSMPETETERYFCSINQPTKLQMEKLRGYGITKVILFSSYNDIYSEIYDAWDESQKIQKEDLAPASRFKSIRLMNDFAQNRPYFFLGKSLMAKRIITYPYFFISRSITGKIIETLKKHTITISLGMSCCGKTYILFDILSKIRNQNVYIIESKSRLTNLAFLDLINRENSLILFDARSIGTHQIETIIIEREQIQKNNTSILIISDKNNRDLSGLIKLYEIRNEIDNGEIPFIEISKQFLKEEIKTINPLLAATDLGIISQKHSSLLDSILMLSKNISEKNKYSDIKPIYKDYRYFSTLILLATKKKVYSSDVIYFDIVKEIEEQVRNAKPMIDIEATWNYEKDASDNTAVKYTLNAEYWLIDQLQSFASDPRNHSMIVEAYCYIIQKLMQRMHASILFDYNIPYKDYIMFDNINRIFGLHGKNGLFLIDKIYAGLQRDLSMDGHYLHQYAKCYIRSAFIESDKSNKIQLLKDANRKVSTAIAIFSERYAQYQNDKITITIAHVEYTRAISLCYISIINEYKNTRENEDAISSLYAALINPFNQD